MDVPQVMCSSSFTECLYSGRNGPIFCATSTPSRKPTLRVLIERRHLTQGSSSEPANQNGPPPCIPKTPKPQTAITRLELEDIEPASYQESLDFSSSFENTIGSCDRSSPKSFAFENIELRIRRRFSDIPRQRFPLYPNWKQTVEDSTTAVNSKAVSKYSRFTSASSLRHSESSRLGFDRNAPTRIAKHRRSRKIDEISRSLKMNSTSTDVISFGKYKTDSMVSSLKQNETSLRCVE